MDALIDGVTYFVWGGGDAGGLYHGDTRHLSEPVVQVDGLPLSTLDEDHSPPARRTLLAADVGDEVNDVSGRTEDGSVTLERRQSVEEGRFTERVAVTNHRVEPWTPRVAVAFDADFADIFEVRGHEEAVERDPAAEVRDDAVTYSYGYPGEGGRRTLTTTVTFDAPPAALGAGTATFEPTIAPQDRWTVEVAVEPGGDVSTVGAAGGTDRRSAAQGRPGLPEAFDTGDGSVDATLRQAVRDVRALTTATDHGPVPLAGAPWYVTVFGRDALLAAYLLLPAAPSLARGTLRFLAAHQGTDHDDRRDQAPGKILHEVRSGELAARKAIPQSPYYGTTDATPLWLVLLHETWRWTGDDELLADLRPAYDAALGWVERAAADGPDDPFVYYDAYGSGGVVHKVWRDSADGVHHADGRRATPPLASAAVQGYVHDALRRAARLADGPLAQPGRADALRERADDLAERFDEAFWLPDRGHYATALAPGGEAVDAMTSNVGHCLWSGIVPDERSERLASLLVDSGLFSGWGVRTTSADDGAFRPASYHAGSVWPHDNAIVALGLARAGHHGPAETVADAQFRAFASFRNNRVPELFCGFDDDRPPVEYPSGCRPQVWAAAAPFGLLRALFDLRPAPDGVAVGNDPGTLRSTAVDPLGERR